MKKTVAFLTAMVLSVSLFTGCGTSKDAGKITSENMGTLEETNLPITNEDITLEIWCVNNSSRVLNN